MKIHGAIAITAIAPLLNLNLNYEKLHAKYTNSFKESNCLKRFFILFSFISAENPSKNAKFSRKESPERRKITSRQALSQEEFSPPFEP